ncbi:MAG TPA: 50S ribosomal protein L25 [Opitutaceae bacterium]|nr:50S ribosomal protein L25 [Opitutaceae bacterium]
MKQQFTLNVSPREGTGRSASRRLRKQDRIPAILYGKHTAPTTLSVEGPEFVRLVKAIGDNAALIELKGTKEQALSILQEVQRDAMTDRYLHVDLHEVKADEKMEINVPVHMSGESTGVKNEAGVLEATSHSLRIRCLPKDLPAFIDVDVTEMHVGQTIHIRELKAVPGVVFLGDKNQPVVSCVQPVEEIVEAVVETAVPVEGVPVEGATAEGAAAVPGAAPAAGAAAAPGAAAGAKPGAPAVAGAKPGAPAAAGGKPGAPAAAPTAGGKPAAADKKASHGKR